MELSEQNFVGRSKVTTIQWSYSFTFIFVRAHPFGHHRRRNMMDV